MSIDRREFLKIAGLTVLGIAGKQATDVLLCQGIPQTYKKTEALNAKRWAMVIQPLKCLKSKGCDDCTKACHSTHNVPKFDNTKDEIKWIWKEHFEHAFPEQKHEFVSENLKHKDVLIFCNHCDNPPCVRVCPTQATWRRDDGLVMMDQHRCIGCRYCVAACPYGSRSFNWRDPRDYIEKINPEYPTRMRGVVEKCNFCAERLAIGLQPACVDACKHGAMTFGDLADPNSEIRKLLHSNYSIRRKPNLGTNPEIYYIV